MDNNIPQLLRDTFDMLLRTNNVTNWKLVSGRNSTLIIHWDTKNGSHGGPNINNNVSLYKRKTPSQYRRDVKRSNVWKTRSTPDTGDSGFKSQEPKGNKTNITDNSIFQWLKSYHSMRNIVYMMYQQEIKTIQTIHIVITHVSHFLTLGRLRI